MIKLVSETKRFQTSMFGIWKNAIDYNFQRRSKMFIDEKIGTDYENWKSGDVVLITAPTGAGKSTFITQKFLKWMILQQKNAKAGTRQKILYLVNRKVLKEQMKAELKETQYKLQEEFHKEGIYMVDLSEYITYETYQYIETLWCQNNMQELAKLVNEHSVAVFDECHYYVADSSFNTRTEISYNFLRQAFYNKLQIYMSATMECVKDKIKQDFLTKAPIPHYENRQFCAWGAKSTEKIKDNYTLEKSYDYVETILLNQDEDLRREILANKSNEKWLIFIDSIEKGNKLKKSLSEGENGIDPDDIVFIDASLDEDDGAEETVNEIENEKKTQKRIIITTPVMDNGISIHDSDLKNIVIRSHDRSSFIQMLGRKRNQADENIKLYLFKRDVQYFRKN